MAQRPGLNLLIVDDSQADTKLLQLWLRDSSVVRGVDLVCAGKKALQFARGEGEFAGRQCPDLVLLDGNLPDMHGLDVLAELKREPSFASVGIFVMSGTFNSDDARRALELGADDYLIKPFEASDFATLVEKIEDYWSRRS